MFKALFYRWVLARRSTTFVVMGLSFLAFGAGSLNLFFVFKANINLLLEHGWMALIDGGFQQLIELLVIGYASIAAYVLFKACEHRLVHWLVEAPRTAQTTAPKPAPKPNPITHLKLTPHEDRNPPR